MIDIAGKRKVIVVTDGDKYARKAIEVAAHNIGARCISASEGNPTPISGIEMVELIKSAEHDPVVVMVDDRGNGIKGKGEKVLEYLGGHPDVDIIGAVAVASNDPMAEGVKVSCSISNTGKMIDEPVDKCGEPEKKGHYLLEGDTVDVINELNVPVVIGTGDTGKMDGADSFAVGAPITTKAFEEILQRFSEQSSNYS